VGSIEDANVLAKTFNTPFKTIIVGTNPPLKYLTINNNN